jgi:hypothetical protein
MTESATRRRRAEWLAPTGLILLSMVPIVAGALRLTELSSGAAVTPGNARFFDSPVPVAVHIVSVTVFSLLGALQFAPSLRRHRWHRLAGRIVAPAGLLAALSALWMTLFYALPASDGGALLVLRLVFGTAMAAGERREREASVRLPRNAFVGRDADLAAVASLLDEQR